MFLTNFIYADKTNLTTPHARSKKQKVIKNKTTLHLPPGKDSFEQHLLRANYQAQIWYNFANSDPSNPQDHGYKQEGLLVLPTPHTNCRIRWEIWSITKHLIQTMTNQMTMAILCVIVLHLMTIRQFLMIFWNVWNIWSIQDVPFIVLSFWPSVYGKYCEFEYWL